MTIEELKIIKRKDKPLTLEQKFSKELGIKESYYVQNWKDDPAKNLWLITLPTEKRVYTLYKYWEYTEDKPMTRCMIMEQMLQDNPETLGEFMKYGFEIIDDSYENLSDMGVPYIARTIWYNFPIIQEIGWALERKYNMNNEN